MGVCVDLSLVIENQFIFICKTIKCVYHQNANGGKCLLKRKVESSVLEEQQIEVKRT